MFSITAGHTSIGLPQCQRACLGRSPSNHARGPSQSAAKHHQQNQVAALESPLARRFIHRSLNSTLEKMLDYEAVAATLSSHTRDAREGTSAFVEKRKPDFKGY